MMHRSTAQVLVAMVFACWLAATSSQSAENVTESPTTETSIASESTTSSSTETDASTTEQSVETTTSSTELNAEPTTTTTTTVETSAAITTIATSVQATNSTSNCPSLRPANIDISEIQGTWYIQAYTGPSDGGQITECDVFNITIDKARNTGSIVYNFIRKGFRQPSVEVANITLLPQTGQFFYEVTGVTLSMMTTVLVFRPNEAYVHLACPTDLSKQSTLVIATKCRTESRAVVSKLLNEAAQHGATAGVRLVDNTNCPAN